MRNSLILLVISLVYIGASDSRESDSRLAQRPVVAKPQCNDPKPYPMESWHSTALAFEIVLGMSPVDGAAEAKRLALKHKFTIDRNSGDSEYFIVIVSWLDPEQVAALRCENSVKLIEFVLPLVLASVMPNNSLQRDREG